jgi:hypothetical protein
VNREQREEYICHRAYQLAETGLHIDCITIVSALIEEGFHDAPEVLNSNLIRADLRQVCAKYWHRTEETELPAPAAPVKFHTRHKARPSGG